MTMSFPAKKDATGRIHHFIRPLDTAARLDIQRQVLTALGFKEEATP